MKFCRRLAVLPFLFLFTGCPLQSQYSLGDSHTARVDQRLLGKWVDAGSETSAKGTVSIFRFNENEYYIEAVDHETNKTDRFRAFMTPIDNVPMLNVQEITEKHSPMKFRFVKVAFSADNTLMLNIVDDGLLSGRSISSRVDLISCIRTNMDNPKLYESLLSLRRKVE